MALRLGVSYKRNDVPAYCKPDVSTADVSLDVPDEMRRDFRLSLTFTLQFELSESRVCARHAYWS